MNYQTLPGSHVHTDEQWRAQLKRASVPAIQRLKPTRPRRGPEGRPDWAPKPGDPGAAITYRDVSGHEHVGQVWARRGGRLVWVVPTEPYGGPSAVLVRADADYLTGYEVDACTYRSLR